jgi:hypothetical protein
MPDPNMEAAYLFVKGLRPSVELAGSMTEIDSRRELVRRIDGPFVVDAWAQ